MSFIEPAAHEMAMRRFLVSYRNMHRAQLVLLLCSIAAIVGCGDGLSRVSGVVTLDGQPIPGGSDVHGAVTFYPADGRGVQAAGMLDESGKYVLKSGSREGVAPGTYVVSVAVNRITMPKTPSEMPQPTLLTPKRYASTSESGLRQEVKSGSNTIDLPLTSAKK
jgi:hypothetical protein